jgi:probable F420-dependent oxidoreductase
LEAINAPRANRHLGRAVPNWKSRRGVDAVAELEDMGYVALWVPGGGAGEILDVAVDLLGTSSRIVVASGILNIWMHDPNEVAKRCHDLEAELPARFLLGLGVSHANIVESVTTRRYERPYPMRVEFLDALDAAPTSVPNDARVLAALGARMVELSRTRSAGAHPYCVPVSNTARARAEFGDGPLLAPEVKVVLERDPAQAREITRRHLARYLAASNYANNLLRLGYRTEDFEAGGSDALVDDLVGCGPLRGPGL